MGFPLFSFRVFIPRSLNFILQHAKNIMIIIFILYHHLHLLIKSCTHYCSSKPESTPDHGDLPQEQVGNDHPVSTLSVPPLQVHPTGNVESSLELEKQIPVMPYCLFLKQAGKDNDQEQEEEEEEECACIVCMNRIERKHQVRMLCNCCHVFHKECIDGWIGEGKRTCPVCRSKLLLHGGDQDEHGNENEIAYPGGDLWRVEEMLSLFGDDFLMGH